MHVASLIIFCHLKKVLRRFCGALLYQISWRAARKADKHGEYGQQRLNSVLTPQLMGFFCCSNEIFAGMWGNMSWNRETWCPCTRPQMRTDNVRHRKRQYGKERLAHAHNSFAWHWVQHLHFYNSRSLLPKVGRKVHSGPVHRGRPKNKQKNPLQYHICF